MKSFFAGISALERENSYLAARQLFMVARALRRPIVTIAGTQVSYSENAGVLFARNANSGQSFYEIRELTR